MESKREAQARRVVMLRHGQTAGNLEKRYIGTTDEPLTMEGASVIHPLAHLPRILIISPMQRCVQTAALLLGRPVEAVLGETCAQTLSQFTQTADGAGIRLYVEDALRECDFGRFENKNYLELSGDRDYQAWIDSGGTLPFPGGESREAFEGRCAQRGRELLAEAGCEAAEGDVLFVVHGGTIMSILARFGLDRSGKKKDYYDWQCANGHGFELLLSFDENGEPVLRLQQEV